jgi:hypothetical protein
MIATIARVARWPRADRAGNTLTVMPDVVAVGLRLIPSLQKVYNRAALGAAVLMTLWGLEGSGKVDRSGHLGLS